MCNFASFVLTRDRVFWLEDSDSHSEIIRRHDLHESGARGLNVLKVEIRPSARVKVWPDLDVWDYTIDQDQMPEWHDPIKDEARARAELARRYKAGFKTVYASGCAALTKLEAPEAQTVHASSCAALTKLEAPKAETVYASGCAALTKLEVPEAKYVDASGCAALTKLEAPEAKYVHASSCAALTKLEAPEAKYVYARGCAALTKLEAPKARIYR